jgi:hypothetical protein
MIKKGNKQEFHTVSLIQSNCGGRKKDRQKSMQEFQTVPLPYFREFAAKFRNKRGMQ